MSSVAPVGPVGGGERLILLDALRGFALLGILFVNMTWFTGFAVLSGAEREALGTARIDAVVAWIVHFAVDSKFWSLFALLFGIGFAMIARRVAERGGSLAGVYLRRMVTLFAIGALHAVFIWFGDIVSLYAVTGIVLLAFLACDDRRLFQWAMTLLLSPVVIAAAWLAFDLATRTAGVERSDPGHGPAALLPFFGSGTYAEAFRANWAFLVERWLLAAYSGRFLSLLGMFLLGVWAVRHWIIDEPESHRPFLWRVFLWGLAIGVPANAFLATFVVDLRPPSPMGVFSAAVRSVGTPALSLAYAAGFTLLYPALNRVMWPLAVAGRMTLTNYVGQSIIGAGLFYGYGLGLWGRIGITWSLAVIAGIFLAQVLFSVAWLAIFAQGPLEWVWRCMTYGRLIRLRRVPGTAGLS